MKQSILPKWTGKICLALVLVLLLSLLGVLPVQAADTNVYVSQMKISCHKDAKTAAKNLTDNGYTIIKKQGTTDNMDFNEGAGGDYVYIGYKTTNDFKDAIKKLMVVHWNSQHTDQTETFTDTDAKFTQPGKTYTIVPWFDTGKTPGDLNSGVGGAFLNLYYTKQISSLQDVKAITPSVLYARSTPEANYYYEANRVPGWSGYYDGENDLNAGASKTYIYLYAGSVSHTHALRYDTPGDGSIHRARCTDCGYMSYAEHELNSQGVKEIIEEPTCTEWGTYYWVYSCKLCGREMQRAIGYTPDNGGHNMRFVYAKTATCTERGNISHYQCTKCKKLFGYDNNFNATDELSEQEVFSPATNHARQRYVAATDSTCVDVGYTSGYFCPDCNTYIGGHAVIPATGEHSPGSPPTCTQPQCCTVCNAFVHPATGHSSITDSAVAVTCTTAGKTQGSHCTVCGDVLIKQTELAALGHDWDAGEITTEPTENTEGVRTYHCTRCSTTRTENIPVLAHVHDFRYMTMAAVSCTEMGFTTHTCTCGYSYRDNIVLPQGHKPVTDPAVPPTCTQAGKTEGTHCTVCTMPLDLQQEVPMLGHSPTTDAAIPPTCTQAGKSAGSHCSVCDAVLTAQKDVAALGHTEVIDEAVMATCSQSGLTEGRHCSVCDKVLTAQTAIDALGHNIITDEARSATCEEIGLTAGSHCTRCDTMTIAQTVIAALGHDIVTDAAAKPATCTEAGISAACHCKRCDYTEVAQVIDALGHLGETDEAVEATCTMQGLCEGSHCIRCSAVLVAQEKTPMLPHTPVIDKALAATCTQTGLTEGSHCSECGTTILAQTELAALAHAWNTGEVTTAPTATEDGLKTFTCTRCNATKTEPIPKTGDWVNPFVDVPAGKWYTDAVAFAVTNELFFGTSDNRFSPDGDMTRAMLVTVLWRLDGKAAPTGSNPFTDVPDGKWYTDAVVWAAENGVVGGIGNGRFDPNGNVTREQMAAILYRYAGKKGYDTSKRADLSVYPDANRISDFAKDALSWANAEGLINGSEGMLLPKGNASRAQVAAILMRYVNNLVK